jgi:Zinc finger, C3HC4 type (RING finger)/ATP-dependent protease La (LON) substrate-binding domain
MNLEESKVAALHDTLLSCPLCMSLFYEPITIACGHSFCRKCISHSLQLHEECPVCKFPCFMNTRGASINFNLDQMIETLFPEEYQARNIQVEEELIDDVFSTVSYLDSISNFIVYPNQILSIQVHKPQHLLTVQNCINNHLPIAFLITREYGFSCKILEVKRDNHIFNLKLQCIRRFRVIEVKSHESKLQIEYIVDESSVDESALEVIAKMIEVLNAITTPLLKSLSPSVHHELQLSVNGILPSRTLKNQSQMNIFNQESYYFCAILSFASFDDALSVWKSTNCLDRLMKCYDFVTALEAKYISASEPQGSSREEWNLCKHIMPSETFRIFNKHTQSSPLVPFFKSKMTASLFAFFSSSFGTSLLILVAVFIAILFYTK